jgi:hypothetical protein
VFSPNAWACRQQRIGAPDEFKSAYATRVTLFSQELQKDNAVD